MKSIFIFTALIFLIGFQSFAQVILTSKFPTIEEPGANFRIDININKSNISGYGRFYQKLPDGLSITRDYTSLYSLKIEGNEVSYFWDNLPSVDQITLSYMVHVDPAITGTCDITAEFFYVQNNSQNISRLIPSKLTVNSPSMSQKNGKNLVTPPVENNKQKAKQVSTNKNKKKTSGVKKPVSNNKTNKSDTLNAKKNMQQK